ncbi:MAG: fasciclin domain-containing protein [Candidatus Bathyarchaeia archaeon]
MVQAAGLVETLKGKGPFTIFVPDDAAFALLPAGTVDELLKNVPKLKAILMYHVLPGKFTVDEIGQMKTAKTLQGQEVKIDAAHWWTLHFNPIINDEAHVISTDIVTDNGIIHVLNRVLMPNMELTCPVCGMGFMTMEAMSAHTKMGHIAEKVATLEIDRLEEPLPPTEVITEKMPIAEKAAEPIQTAEVMPVVEKAPEPMLPAEVMPVVEKMPEPTATTEVMPEPVSATAKAATGVFEIIRDSDRKFRFHLKAANGLIIAVSQSYGTREAAVKGIASIMKNAPMAKVTDFTSTGGTRPEITHAGIVCCKPILWNKRIS